MTDQGEPWTEADNRAARRAEDMRWLKIAGVIVLILGGLYLMGSMLGGERAPADPADVARAMEGKARDACQGLVRDRVGSAEFRDVQAVTTGTRYKIEGRADTPGQSYRFTCTGQWEQDADGEAGTVRVRLDSLD